MQVLTLAFFHDPLCFSSVQYTFSQYHIETIRRNSETHLFTVSIRLIIFIRYQSEVNSV